MSKPEPSQHQCPYDGAVLEARYTAKLVSNDLDGTPRVAWDIWPCGRHGALCDRCKEDRADARAAMCGRWTEVRDEAADATSCARQVADCNAKLRKRIDALEARLREVAAKADSLESDATADEQCLIDRAELLRRIEALEARLPGPQTPLQDLGTHSMAPLTPRPLSEDDLGTRHCDCEQCNDEPTQHGDAMFDNLPPIRKSKKPEARTCGNCGTGPFPDDDYPEGAREACPAELPMWADDWVEGCNRMVCPSEEADHCAAWTPKEEVAAWWNERPGEQRFDSQLDYSIALGRAIEHHCRMVEVPESIAKECPHHAAMLNDHLGRVSRKPEPEPEPTRNAAEPPHQCPYGGYVNEAGPCGTAGWLCDRCKQDRADARAGVGNRLLALEEYATAIDARASSTEVDVQAMSTALADAQTRLAQVEVKVAALESRLPGPQTRTQDLGTFDAQTGQRVDEPTQHGEARTCGNCGHGPVWERTVCRAPVPMWADDGDQDVVEVDRDATHCDAWTPKESGNG